MARAGAPQEVIERTVAHRADPIEVLACNWQAVQVFQRCQQTMVSTGMGSACMGIAAGEVRDAATLMRVGADAWPDVLDGVQHMGRVAAAVINTAAKDATRCAR